MNLGYTGKPYDKTTGLYNYGYRDYKPQAARFTTADPIRDGNNWYAYVNNDPVNWSDPLGLFGLNAQFKEASFDLGQSFMNNQFSANKLAKTPLGPAAPLIGILGQFVVSSTVYAGFATAALGSWIFGDGGIKNDFINGGWNPFNTSTKTVIDSKYISFFRGVPVFRIGGNDNFSIGAIFLSSNEEGKLEHERGHNTQSMLNGGISSFGLGVAIPSGWSQVADKEKHGTYPWEREATRHGEKDASGFWDIGGNLLLPLFL